MDGLGALKLGVGALIWGATEGAGTEYEGRGALIAGAGAAVGAEYVWRGALYTPLPTRPCAGLWYICPGTARGAGVAAGRGTAAEGAGRVAGPTRPRASPPDTNGAAVRAAGAVGIVVLLRTVPSAGSRWRDGRFFDGSAKGIGVI